MKIKTIIIAFLSLVCYMLLGCAPQATQLPKPTNLKVVERVLTWDIVENADGYIVFADDQEYETAKNSFDLSFLKAGKYVIEVMAVGDYETFTDSDWAKLAYTAEKEEEIIPTEGLRYTLLEDGTGYEVHRGTSSSVQKVVIPDTHEGLPVKKIAEMAFQLGVDPQPLLAPAPYSGCDVYLKEVRLPKYLEEIGDNAFGYCLELSNVTIPKNVKKIGKEAFYFTSLPSIQIPEGVETIGEYAFGFTEIVEAQLPDTLKHIPKGLFFGCKNLETIRFPANIESFGSSVVVNTKWYVNFPNDYVIVDGFLLGYKGTSSMNAIPKTVTHIVDRAFSHEYEKDVQYTMSWQNTFCVAEKAVLPAFVVLGEKLFCGNELLKEVVFENGTEIIPDYTCESCSNLEKVTIPQSVQRIGAGAFRASGLTKIDLPSGLTSIAKKTFAASKITEITWPENLVEIGESAFSNCDFKQLNLPQSVTTIGERAFASSTYLESLTLPLSVTHLGNEAFRNCKKLTSFHFSSLPHIGEQTFYSCTSLNDVVLPEGLETLPLGTFDGCESLKNIHLPSTITEIGKRAFANCTSLESIQLPNNLQTLGDHAFLYCKLKSLALPNSLKTLGNNCFDRCELLEEIDLSNVENIGAFVFLSCSSLKKVVLPKHITSIPKSYFYSCSSLTEIVLPKGVTTITQYAFNNCTALKTVYFEGSQEEFSAMVVENKNEAFLNATVCFYSETEPTLNSAGTAYDGNYWHYAPDNKTPIAWIKET